jgi:hypothetical protein
MDCSPSSTPETDAFAQRLTDAKVPASRAWPHWYDHAKRLETERNETIHLIAEMLAFGGEPNWELDPDAKKLYDRCLAITAKISENKIGEARADSAPPPRQKGN